MMTATSMHRRRPGELVINQLLTVQSAVRTRSGLERLVGRSPLSTESWPWYQGALGEIAVGRLLDRLPEGWTVFHALPIGTKGSDIDHVVVGPGGVYTINTKHHSGKAIWVADRTVMVSGQKQTYIRDATYEAERVARLFGSRLPVPVQPVIALVDPKSLTVRKRPDRVVILDAARLLRHLTKAPVVLDPQSVATAESILADPALWAVGREADADAAARFESLDRQVRSARTRRRVWAVGLLGATVAGFAWVVQWLPAALMHMVVGG